MKIVYLVIYEMVDWKGSIDHVNPFHEKVIGVFKTLEAAHRKIDELSEGLTRPESQSFYVRRFWIEG